MMFSSYRQKIVKSVFAVFCVVLIAAICQAQPAQPDQPEAKPQQTPPLPVHNVEGNSGVFITPTAYLANPAQDGQTFGLPSASFSYVQMRQKDFESVAVTENVLGRLELGYALERMGLGDWPKEVKAATGFHTDNHVLLHNFNARFMVIKEGDFDCPAMPAITIGSHFKWNQSLHKLNRQLSGTCDAIGADNSSGVEFTAIASKTFPDLFGRPIIVSAGIRNSDAIHTGLLGFAGTRRTTFEGSVILFLNDRLLLASEYRQKSDLADKCSAGGKELVKSEDDWWDICLGYIVDANTTIAGGYANFGNVLNNREDNVWALQLKYEF